MAFLHHARHAVMRGALTTLRLVTRDDLPLLSRWFVEPEFVRWWGGVPKSPDEVAEECLGRDDGLEIVLSFIVMRDAEPIGYIQAWSDVPRIGGIDIVLVPQARGSGCGPDAVAALARFLRDDAGWTRIIVDPSMHNERAIRAFEKAGFVRERDAPDHPDGPSLILAFGSPRQADAPGPRSERPECTSVDPGD